MAAPTSHATMWCSPTSLSFVFRTKFHPPFLLLLLLAFLSRRRRRWRWKRRGEASKLVFLGANSETGRALSPLLFPSSLLFSCLPPCTEAPLRKEILPGRRRRRRRRCRRRRHRPRLQLLGKTLQAFFLSLKHLFLEEGERGEEIQTAMFMCWRN